MGERFVTLPPAPQPEPDFAKARKEMLLLDRTVNDVHMDEDSSAICCDATRVISETLIAAESRLSSLAEENARLTEERDELREMIEHHKADLNAVLHPNGDGPKAPALCDLVAYTRGDLSGLRQDKERLTQALLRLMDHGWEVSFTPTSVVVERFPDDDDLEGGPVVIASHPYADGADLDAAMIAVLLDAARSSPPPEAGDPA